MSDITQFFLVVGIAFVCLFLYAIALRLKYLEETLKKLFSKDEEKNEDDLH